MRVGVQGSFSEWVDVLSGVHQGSVLSPLLSDFCEWPSELGQEQHADVWGRHENFKRNSSGGDSLSLQEDLHQLMKLSAKWLLWLNPEKCKVIHVGYNVGTQYHMMENGKMVTLEVTKEEKDFGIYTTNKPQYAMHESGVKSKVGPGHDSATFQDYRPWRVKHTLRPLR